MSRLQPLRIPFSAGQTDEINPKLLPTGVFSDVQNGRMPQQGGLRLRRGWRPLTMTAADGTSLTAIDIYSYNGAPVVLHRDAATKQYHLATYTAANASRPWALYNDNVLSPATGLRPVGNNVVMNGNILHASAGLTSDGVYGITCLQSSTENIFRVFRRTDDTTLGAFAFGGAGTLMRVFGLGSVFGLLIQGVSGIDFYTLDPAAASAPTFSFVATIGGGTGILNIDVAVQVTATTPTVFHVAIVKSTNALLVEKVTISSGAVVSTTLASSGVQSAAVFNANNAALLVLSQATVSGDTSLYSLNPALMTTTLGPTAAISGAQANKIAVAGDTTTTAIYVAAEVSTAPRHVDVQTYSTSQVLSTTVTYKSTSLHGGPVAFGANVAFGMVRGDALTDDFLGTAFYGDATGAAAWFLQEQGAAFFEGTPATRTLLHPGQAQTGDILTLALLATNPLTGVVQTALLGSTARRPATSLAGALYIAGGQLAQWVGGLSENGMLEPVIRNGTDNGAGHGSVAAGTYSYCGVLTWVDELGRKHRSPVGTALTQVVAADASSVTVKLEIPKTNRRNANVAVNPTVELYRTEAGPGDLFYLVTTAPAGLTDDEVAIADTIADATLITQAQLYTQGETGATSGILEQAPARGCDFIAATKRRLVCGTADTSYQWSQTTLPDLPVFFAEPGVSGDAAQAYFDDAEGAITGVVAIDEIVYIGTAKRVLWTGGVGPNLAGTGEFTPPQTLPTDTGFYNGQTLLVTSEGLWFQGGANTMYLLARGTPTPTLSRAVQDHMTGTLVGCGYGATDNVAAWAMKSPNRVLFRQLDTKQWFNDTLPFTPAAMCDVGGQLYAVDSAGGVWTQDASAYGDGASGATGYALQVTTGALVPFGLAGWGRVAVIEVLGEYQADATVLAEISYDDGVTWTTLGGGAFTVSGLAAGATWSRQFYPLRQRGGRFRVRLTMTPSVSTTEGSRLTGLTVYYVLKSGQTRLDSAKRK